MIGMGPTLTDMGKRRAKGFYRKSSTSDRPRLASVGVSCGGGCGSHFTLRHPLLLIIFFFLLFYLFLFFFGYAKQHAGS